MRNQQEAEKAEQQRIKKLVLNYDLRTEDTVESDGTAPLSDAPGLQPNLNLLMPVPRFAQKPKRTTRGRGH